ncbi:DUF1120 domain-containing protein [Herbaspirillum chlorophenolicum]|uniref:DUF1120 domain-containing protein n=1 Tax=Herbaspirillum chlorophenolicum TaxID=211589 RepID=A0ABW8F4V4_9BURK
MKLGRHIVCSLCLAGVFVRSSFAGTTAELAVVGTIRAGACQLLFLEPGPAHFGVISTKDFKDRKRLHLDSKDIAFTIVCDVRTRVGITPRDNQRDSADRSIGEGVEGEDSHEPADVFGLGRYGDRNLGGFVARFVESSLIADGRRVEVISAPADAEEGARWERRNARQIRGGVTNAWGARGTLAPGTYSNISGVMRIRPVLNKQENLTQDTSIDGSLTFELAYL